MTIYNVANYFRRAFNKIQNIFENTASDGNKYNFNGVVLYVIIIDGRLLNVVVMDSLFEDNMTDTLITPDDEMDQ